MHHVTQQSATSLAQLPSKGLRDRLPHLRVVQALSLVIVFLVHFRPWQGGLLEDWSMALVWDVRGPQAFLDTLPATAGRPLHLVPHFLGLVISSGGFVGPFLVLAVVATLQFVGGLWALGPVVRSPWVRTALALAIGLHAWWPGGQILRFMPAQVAVLGTVIWLGAAVRYLQGLGRRWLVLVVVAPLLGLLHYQAPAAAMCLGAVVLVACLRASWARRVRLVGATVAIVAGVMTWSVFLAPKIVSETYETTIMSTGVSLRASIGAIARTVVHLSPWLIVLALAICVVAVILLGGGSLTTGPALLILAACGASPAAALVFASQPAHLNDPERVALPIGIALWLTACVVASAAPARLRWLKVVAAALAAASVVGALGAYNTWTRFSRVQQSLLAAVNPTREDLPADGFLVVKDLSGTFGDVYTFLPPHLDIAFDVQEGPGADVLLCTPTAVVRDQPVAARFPLMTTPTCEDLIGNAPSSLLDEVDADGRRLELVELDTAPVGS